ncbi:hypothetical protein PIB30_105338, partial [Stylosanthes scabra]|nr:hypothetical protein [Stylosanthes scabra]
DIRRFLGVDIDLPPPGEEDMYKMRVHSGRQILERHQFPTEALWTVLNSKRGVDGTIISFGIQTVW